MQERHLLVLCIFVMIIGQIIILHVYRWDNYGIFRQKIEDDRYIFVDKSIVKTFRKPTEFYQGMNGTYKVRNIQNMEKLNGINNNEYQTGQHNMNTTKMKDRNLTRCSEYLEEFHGKETVHIVNESMANLETIFKDVTNGGHWKPWSCKAINKISVIVPLCGELKHFLVFLGNTIPKLKRQLVEFTIFIVEPGPETECNVGLMRNIGFIEATKQRQYDCIIFNDVATVIENDRNLYTCHQGALLHMAVSVDNKNNKHIQKSKIAGIQSFDSRVYKKINGNSNIIQSGLVDDDLFQRLLKQDITIHRPAGEVATVTLLRRNQTTFVGGEKKLTEIAPFHHKDGLNSTHYEILSIERKQLFTRIVFKSNATHYQQMLLKYLQEDAEKKTHSRFSQKIDNLTTLDKSGNKMSVKKFNDKGQATKNQEALRRKVATRTLKKLWTAPQSMKWFLKRFFNRSSRKLTALPIPALNETNKRHLIYRIAYNACAVVKKYNESIKTLQKTENQTEVLECPFCSPFLEGRQLVQTKPDHSMKFLENYFSDVVGGHWFPKSCKARLRVAIIVPYRNRERHFRTLLLNLIPKLKRQQIDFTIYLVEQGLYSKFNRGLMRNIGFLIASKERDYDCYIFNDVDTIIEDDRNLFTCIDGAALHIAVAVDVFGYQLKYLGLIGGILSMNAADFNKTNGFSNLFFMWGGEDDSLSQRLKTAKIPILRPIENISMTTTLRHQKDKRNNERFRRVKESEYFVKEDGLKSVTYKNLRIMKKKLYTWIYVNIDQNYYENLLVEWRRSMHSAKYKKNATINGTEQSNKEQVHNRTLEIGKKTQQNNIQSKGNTYKDMKKVIDNGMRQWNTKQAKKRLSSRTKSQPESNTPDEVNRAKKSFN